MGQQGSKLFLELTEEKKTAKPKGKGRSTVLISARNEKIFYRYYYYSKILQYRFDLVMSALVNEFDLSKATITEITMDNADRLREVSKEKLSRAQLKTKYPHFNWNDRPMVPDVVRVQRPVYDRY